MKRTYTILCLTLTLSLFTNSAWANLSAPAGLSPGDHFYWVFVTSTGYDALSNHIGDYNTFVNDVADAATLTLSGVETGGGPVTSLGDIDWKAIASTQSKDARDNIGDPLSAIYRLDGVQVAADEAALWNTASVDLLAPINVDETLASGISTDVWTGTAPDGSGFISTSPLVVSHALGNYDPILGDSSSSSLSWVSTGTTNTGNPNDEYPFYAISEELTVSNVQVVPLPGAIVLVILGLLSLMASSVALSQRKRTLIGDF